jgi:hypothetical protein
MAATKRKKDPAAVALGRKGGKKGGPARAAKLTPAQRSESARKAVRARWAKVQKYEAVHVAVSTSDHAVLEILSRIKATKDIVEVRKLSDQLEQVIFHKQYSDS